jgi:hypothetical protein
MTPVTLRPGEVANWSRMKFRWRRPGGLEAKGFGESDRPDRTIILLGAIDGAAGNRGIVSTDVRYYRPLLPVLLHSLELLLLPSL